MKYTATFPIHRQSGFSLIELLVYMAILAVLMTMVMISFTKTMQRSGQQSTIAETALESGIGLDMLRLDLEHAGFGLPWEWQGAISYTEPGPFSGATTADPPRPISSGDLSTQSLNGSDYLVIRGSNLARGQYSQRWGYVGRNSLHQIHLRAVGGEDFENTDRFIVIRPQTESGNLRQLLMDGNDYLFTKSTINKVAPPETANDPDGEKYVVYSVNDKATTKRPFNRVDYLINNANVPAHCAQNTGVLGKLQINQENDNGVMLPIIDCVADFQVVFYMDTDNDGGWDAAYDADEINGLTASEIRDQVKAISCYILGHEGGFDPNYTHPNNEIVVGETINGKSVGRTFDLADQIAGNWANYRWKVYSATVSPKNFQ